jgi:glycine/D-amino acid oxidase-like deaminating enzyme
MPEKTPTFGFTPPLRCVAGVRPFRRDGYRLEARRSTSVPSKFIVHNYGHGGAGISLSWGMASKVRDLVRNHVTTTGDTAVAVLGSGVMGLTAATLLVELGLQVTIYTKECWPETTSNVAGGQWAPSVVDYSNRQEFREVLEFSYRRFEASIGQGYGVSRKENYTTERHPAFESVMRIAPGLIPDPDVLPALPFEHLTAPGFRYHTLLIEPPVFLGRLRRDLEAANVPIVQRTFANVASVLSLQENIIVNCTGYGAKALWGDNKLQPIKGQLALIDPDPELDYLFGRSGYLFPRSDAVVIGGTFEQGVEDTTANPVRCQKLVDDLKRVFGTAPVIGLEAERRPLDDDIDHPQNLRYLAPQEVEAEESGPEY